MATTGKRLFIVHGWGGYPEECWFPWLASACETIGFEVYAPRLPDTDNPNIPDWTAALRDSVSVADEHTYFVGHSLGVQAIVRYLETLPDGARVGGAVFVAGFLKRLILEDENDADERRIAEHWLTAPVDLQKVRRHLPASIAIFSDDDPDVPLDNQDAFRDALGSAVVIERGMGHFTGITELPVVFRSIQQLI